MANVNENYLKLQGSYLFANIAKKVNEYQAAHQMRILFALVSATLHCHWCQQSLML